MAREDIIMLSSKEMRRVKIINEVLEKHVTQVEAGEILELSERQVRRIACCWRSKPANWKHTMGTIRKPRVWGVAT